jgi:hypothetical protein
MHKEPRWLDSRSDGVKCGPWGKASSEFSPLEKVVRLRLTLSLRITIKPKSLGQGREKTELGSLQTH